MQLQETLHCDKINYKRIVLRKKITQNSESGENCYGI